MITSLVLTCLLAQAGEQRSPIGIVISSKRKGAEEMSAKYVAKLQVLLKKEGVTTLPDAKLLAELKDTGLDDPRNCDGAISCLGRVAVVLGAHSVVIGVDVGKIQKSLAVHLEAVAADTGESIAVTDFVAREDRWAEQSAASLMSFVRDMKGKLTMPAQSEPPPKKTPEKTATQTPPEDKPKTDVPKKTREPDLEPHDGDPKPGENAVKPPPKQGKGALPWVFAGGAAAGAIATGVLAGIGWDHKTKHDSSLKLNSAGQLGTTLTEAEYQRLGTAANTEFTGALIAGIATAALAGLSVVFFVKE